MNQQFKKVSNRVLENMNLSLIDYAEMFKYISKHLQDHSMSLKREIYNHFKVCFIKQAQKSWAKSDRHSHSLTYFLFLSIKMEIYDEDLFKFVVGELYYNQSQMELESIILLLFTFSRVERMIGLKSFEKVLDY